MTVHEFYVLWICSILVLLLALAVFRRISTRGGTLTSAKLSAAERIELNTQVKEALRAAGVDEDARIVETQIHSPVLRSSLMPGDALFVVIHEIKIYLPTALSAIGGFAAKTAADLITDYIKNKMRPPNQPLKPEPKLEHKISIVGPDGRPVKDLWFTDEQWRERGR